MLLFLFIIFFKDTEINSFIHHAFIYDLHSKHSLNQIKIFLSLSLSKGIFIRVLRRDSNPGRRTSMICTIPMYGTI